jgi:hypothetical protein
VVLAEAEEVEADLFREVDGFEHVPDRLCGRPVAAVVSAGRGAERVDPELEIHAAPLRNADRELAPRVRRRQRSKRLGRLRDLVRRLDGHAQHAVGEQAREAFEVFGRGRGHDHRPPGTFARGSGRRGDTAAVLGESRGDVRRVVDQVEHRVEADADMGHGWMSRLVDSGALAVANFERVRKAEIP